jgi:GlpG protein
VPREVFRCAASLDIGELSRLLWQQNIQHRMDVFGSWQIVSVPDSVPDGVAEAVVLAWRNGEELNIQVVQSSQRESLQNVVDQMSVLPVTSALCFFSVLGFAATQWLNWDSLLKWLSFQEIYARGGQLYLQDNFETIANGQVWRLITPAFIHFGWMHIAFNMLWTLDFGRCIERTQGSRRLILLFLCFALLSNVAQAVLADQLFGGMSGVIYGFLGYCFIYNKRNPGALPCVPPALFGFMVGWLLLCMSGIVTLLGFGNIANAAHVAGLLAGLLAGFIWPVEKRL